MAGPEKDSAGPSAPAALEIPAKNSTMLYVEDNQNNLKLMEMIVSQLDFLSMLSAPDAMLGIQLAKSERPDLIILDINLPGMNGFEALAKLLENEGTKHIPVLALSANADAKDIEKGLQAGFRFYLGKPIKIPELLAAIVTSLEVGESAANQA